MLLDKTSEAIAHFIGLFETFLEQARQRDAYDEFVAKQERLEQGELPNVEVSYEPVHEFVEFQPGVGWSSGPLKIVTGELGPLPYLKVEVDIEPPALEGGLKPMMKMVSVASGGAVAMPDIEPLGSVASYINQMIGLSDDDDSNVGGSGLDFNPASVTNERLEMLAKQASEILFQAGSDVPGSAEALVALSDAMIDYFESQDPDSAPDNVFVHKADTIDSTYVNGELVEEAPELEDHFSLKDRMEEGPRSDAPFEPNAHVGEDGIVVIEQSVEIEMGQNTLINNAVVTNLWTSSPVMAVIGDHTELNVISQVNAYADADSVTAMLQNWAQEPSGTETFNIASFGRDDPMEDAEGTSGTATGSFPSNWIVETVEGDLMIVNWIQQFTFMTDNDIGIVSSSGVTSTVYSGDNAAINGVSIYELGFAYDLIVIGGSVYDINVIQQMNVLYDNDMIGAVDGFQTSGEGSYDTSGNLLWNEAHIFNVGGADRFEAMSDSYKQDAIALANGDHSPNSMLSDPMFAGSGTLRVLHIEGDFINVQSIRQTNILGDADQLALAMHRSGFFDQSDWSVTTGNNALVNYASIADLDSLGKTYVGGNQYSQELLVQADIISTAPELGWQSPDALVNEAVAFLANDDWDDASDAYADGGYLLPEDHQHDGLQSMLS
jgi:hypothetical protein